ncbi:PH domain-containing protein [Miltoncostaea marina]|uniref:PH domain-containing protein n=1 Tax=Miltoncostaea marina TaxID=2843215 RepID=UPI001C3D8D65|nr:PH domain-containing protein [Miltoncostaea marina]
MERISELANQKLRSTVGRGRELRALPEILGDREQVLNLAGGEYDGNMGLLVVTDRRVIFFDKGLMRSRQEDFPYERISSVQTETKLMYGRLTIFASGNKAIISKVDPKARVGEIGDYIRARISGGPATPASAPDQAATSPHDRLRKLKDLHEEGLLTDAEYEQKRSAALAEL